MAVPSVLKPRFHPATAVYGNNEIKNSSCQLQGQTRRPFFYPSGLYFVCPGSSLPSITAWPIQEPRRRSHRRSIDPPTPPGLEEHPDQERGIGQVGIPWSPTSNTTSAAFTTSNLKGPAAARPFLIDKNGVVMHQVVNMFAARPQHRRNAAHGRRPAVLRSSTSLSSRLEQGQARHDRLARRCRRLPGQERQNSKLQAVPLQPDSPRRVFLRRRRKAF